MFSSKSMLITWFHTLIIRQTIKKRGWQVDPSRHFCTIFDQLFNPSKVYTTILTHYSTRLNNHFTTHKKDHKIFLQKRRYREHILIIWIHMYVQDTISTCVHIHQNRTFANYLLHKRSKLTALKQILRKIGLVACITSYVTCMHTLLYMRILEV